MIQHLKQSNLRNLRKKLLKRQGNLCPVCYRDLSLEESVLDHSHKKRLKGTGLIRGVLHRTCNSFISKSENNAVRYRIPLVDLPDVLRRTASYLEQSPLPYLHPSERPKAPRITKRSYRKLYLLWRNDGMSQTLPGYGRGRLTKKLKKYFDRYDVVPTFYADKKSRSPAL